MHGFSEAHVIGEAGPEAEALQEPHPPHAGGLVWSEGGVEVTIGIEGAGFFWAAQCFQRFFQPSTGGEARPVGGFRIFVFRGGAGGGQAGEQAHSLEERDAFHGM